MSTMIFHQLRSVYRSTNLSISTWPFLSLICRCWAAEFMIPAASEGFTQLPNVQIAALTRFLVKSCFQIVDEPRLTVKVEGHRYALAGIEAFVKGRREREYCRIYLLFDFEGRDSRVSQALRFNEQTFCANNRTRTSWTTRKVDFKNLINWPCAGCWLRAITSARGRREMISFLFKKVPT